MADWTAKQLGFTQRYAAAVQQLMATADALTALDAEFAADAYGTGGANAITDVVVQTILPAATAAQFCSAEGAVVSILTTIATSRGYLEMLRP